MGMYDELVCKYPLPLKNANAYTFQTKDLDSMMDHYEIREDGTLWHEAYESRVEVNDDAPLGMWLHRDNKRWEPVTLTGEVRFYEFIAGAPGDANWIEFSAYYVKGALKHIETIKLPEHLQAGRDAATEVSVTPAASEARDR